MTTFYAIFLFFLITTFYLSSQSITHASSLSSSISPARRKAIRELSMSTSEHQQEKRKLKVVGKGRLGRVIRGATSTDVEDSGNDEDGDDLVYHIDYHGVMTHPTPTPKHPKP